MIFLLIAFALIVVGKLLRGKCLNKLHNEYHRCANGRGCVERYGSNVHSRDPYDLESAYQEAIPCAIGHLGNSE